uniref:Uncharacterized protein n=1 Tax=Anguilla anguilla TaxID=7936 RepID=A0A0E9VUR1_ANGAN
MCLPVCELKRDHAYFSICDIYITFSSKRLV